MQRVPPVPVTLLDSPELPILRGVFRFIQFIHQPIEQPRIRREGKQHAVRQRNCSHLPHKLPCRALIVSHQMTDREKEQRLVCQDFTFMVVASVKRQLR